MKTITTRLEDNVADRLDATVLAAKTSGQKFVAELITDALEPCPSSEEIIQRVNEIDGHDSAKVVTFLAWLSEFKPSLRVYLGRALNCPAITKQYR